MGGNEILSGLEEKIFPQVAKRHLKGVQILW